MKEMKHDKVKTLYLWMKRGAVSVAIFSWTILMAKIFASGGGMQKQAPQCIFTTMIVFGVLTLAYKGIEKLEKR